MRYLSFLLLGVLVGCVSQTSAPHQPVIKKQAPSLSPTLIEINSVPPPFDLGGDDPYVVWMNGKKVNLPKSDVVALVNKVGKENIPPIDVADIHKGWLWPHYVKREELPANTSRTRQLKERK